MAVIITPDNQNLESLSTTVDGAGFNYTLDRQIIIPSTPRAPVVVPNLPTPDYSPAPENFDTIDAGSKQRASTEIDGQIWELQATLNNLSVENPTNIPVSNIHELTIEHDVLDPCFLRGSMIVTANRFGAVTIAGDAPPGGRNPDREVQDEIVIRGDGRDYLTVTIEPVFPNSDQFPPEVWRIHNEFVIYDSEDIPWKNQTGQAKKLFFWHIGYQSMIETDSVFNTGNYVNDHPDDYSAIPSEYKTDMQRSMTVSAVIKRLLQTAGLQRYIDEDEWDLGSDDSRVFYSCNGTESILDTIQNVLPLFVAADGSPGILYFHRGKNLGGNYLGAFQLISIKKLFDKIGVKPSSAKEFYYETFIVGTSDSGTVDVPVESYKSLYPDQGKLTHDIKIKKYSMIQDNSYVLSDPAGTDSTQSLVSQIIHTYDNRDKAFKYSYINSDIVNFKARLKQNYTDIFHPGTKGDALLTLNNIKKDNRRLNHRFVPHADKRFEVILKTGDNYLLRSALFLNLGISFKVQGSTHRHPGRFVGLEKLKESNNRYDYRLLGTWFVTNATIRWENGSLFNTIAATKVSTYRSIGLDEDVD